MLKHASFVPPLGLANAHVQTLLPRLVGGNRAWSGHWQKIELDDGDFVELCWRKEPDPQSSQPLLVLFHGLEGSVDSPYVWQTMDAAHQLGWNSVVMHFRGCGKRAINRLPRAYHSGDTNDAAFVLNHLHQHYSQMPLYASGFSLGGNMLAQLLTLPIASVIKAATIACAPLDLLSCSERIDRGFSRIYRRYLLTPLKRKVSDKIQQGIIAADSDIAQLNLADMRSFLQFDDVVTAPLHGFTGVHDYYQQASGRQFLADIKVPTLIIHALDDPFLGPRVIPEHTELSDNIDYEISQHGGHMGFMQYRQGRWTSWLPQRLTRFFQQQS